MSKEPEVTQNTPNQEATFDTHAEAPPSTSPSSRKQQLAWAMIASSFVLYASLFLIPFLSWGARPKLVLFGVLFTISEVTFWGGGLILGKEIFQRYRVYLNPMSWWRRPPTNEGNEHHNKRDG